MPITTDIDNEKHLTTHKVIGDVPLEELMIPLKQFWEGPQTMNVLWDFREWTTFMSPEEIKSISDYIEPHYVKHPKYKTALVVTKEFENGMVKMISALGRIKELTYQIDTFLSYEDAIRWLGAE